MTTSHRLADQEPQTAVELRHRGPLKPTCVHGQIYEMAYPNCGQRPCWIRWWTRYGTLMFLVIAMIFILGMTVYRNPSVPPCRNGWVEHANTCYKP